MSARGKGKFNKTKRGVARQFTEDDDIDRSVEAVEKLKLATSDSESDSESDSAPQQSRTIKDNTPEFIYRNTERPIVEIGKVVVDEPVEEFKVANSNRAPVKNLKASDLAGAAAAPMSRKEREAQEAERKKAAFWKAQMEGKTDQAKSDLARLAIIRKQREDAARKKAEEAAEKASSASKAASLSAGKGIISKSLGGK